MTTGTCAAIILAAGKGTRMKSNLPKVLHPVANRPMISHLLDTVTALSPDKTIVVISPKMGDVAETVAPVKVVEQREQLGTGHAVLAARDAIEEFTGDILVLYGDTPLLTAATLQKMFAMRRGDGNPAIVVLGFRPEEPGEYGRVVIGSGGRLEAIVEYRDASSQQRKLDLCNAGIMVIDGAHLFALLDAVGNDNPKGEFYLTDIIEIAVSRGLKCGIVEANDPAEVMGINSRRQLADAEAAMQRRLRAEAMEIGVTMIDPDTVWLSADTKLGRDVSIEPNVFFGPGVTIGDNVQVRSFCYIEGTQVASNAVVGPFARLRSGTKLENGVRVGNFVEIKEALIEQNTKINHLSYIGDARIGPRTNIGAGVITCNYDGFSKDRTDVGAGAFIGSNTALVAPINIGDGAIIGAGSVITSDVGAHALGIARGRQRNIEDRAKSFRSRRQTKKDVEPKKK
ncbi:MAG: bifunctional UDP-N-acetylglucosamine diphosphorylase/glucosamine-1-phosphate N-acetyltransferase GlmU [Pseudomonadota bacterium]|nr:bifunctional UDP-N-acetylglucosamine diphosphorylase/glucosamine-1-phosphate N-acetyltransferase GlmU [Pseudomonadota bacterium]